MYYEFVMAFIITRYIYILLRHIEKSYLRQLPLRMRKTNFTLSTKLMENVIYIRIGAKFDRFWKQLQARRYNFNKPNKIFTTLLLVKSSS